MLPALHIDQSWLCDDAAELSETWRWFYLEHWLPIPAFAIGALSDDLHLDASAPSGNPEVLRLAAWTVVEAIRRDGISRGHLTSDEMRWARRLGLALLGDGPSVGGEPMRGGWSALERSVHAANEVAAVVGIFPSQERAVLQLALEARPAVRHAAALGGVPEYASKQLPAASFLYRQSAKASLLVRLAKKHVAAGMGIDLRNEPGAPTEAAGSHPADVVGEPAAGIAAAGEAVGGASFAPSISKEESAEITQGGVPAFEDDEYMAIQIDPPGDSRSSVTEDVLNVG
ncbi:hypothetical protein BH09PSE5_BH09PSE5_16920 [soil metagenome]